MHFKQPFLCPYSIHTYSFLHFPPQAASIANHTMTKRCHQTSPIPLCTCIPTPELLRLCKSQHLHDDLVHCMSCHFTPLAIHCGSPYPETQHYSPIIVQKSLPDIGVQQKSFQPFIISCPFQEVQILDLLGNMPQIHWEGAQQMECHSIKNRAGHSLLDLGEKGINLSWLVKL